jgi:hypothetical protein
MGSPIAAVYVILAIVTSTIAVLACACFMQRSFLKQNSRLEQVVFGLAYKADFG